MKKNYVILLLATLIIACSKDQSTNSTNPTPNPSPTPTDSIKYPYFTLDKDTFGGIATKQDGFYGCLTSIVGVCPNQTEHRIKNINIQIEDTTKFNTAAKLKLTTGSQSVTFKNKGVYPLLNFIDNANHFSCTNYNTCGHPNEIKYDHEGGDFLVGDLTINNYNYKIYSGSYTLSAFNEPLSGTFKGKAYKAKQPYTGMQVDLTFYDTTKTIDIFAKFK